MRRGRSLAPAGMAGALKDTMDGLRYVRGNSSILLLLLLGLLSLLFLQPFMVLLPEIADNRFDIGTDWLVMFMNDIGLGFIIGATLFGTFLTFMGIGSIMGPTFLAYLGNVSNKGALIVGSMALSGVVLAALGAAPWLVLALAVMVVLGMLDSSQRVITNSLLLTQTDSEFHGRVISLYLLDQGLCADRQPGCGIHGCVSRPGSGASHPGWRADRLRPHRSGHPAKLPPRALTSPHPPPQPESIPAIPD